MWDFVLKRLINLVEKRFRYPVTHEEEIAAVR